MTTQKTWAIGLGLALLVLAPEADEPTSKKAATPPPAGHRAFNRDAVAREYLSAWNEVVRKSLGSTGPRRTEILKSGRAAIVSRLAKSYGVTETEVTTAVREYQAGVYRANTREQQKKAGGTLGARIELEKGMARVMKPGYLGRLEAGATFARDMIAMHRWGGAVDSRDAIGPPQAEANAEIDAQIQVLRKMNAGALAAAKRSTVTLTQPCGIRVLQFIDNTNGYKHSFVHFEFTDGPDAGKEGYCFPGDIEPAGHAPPAAKKEPGEPGAAAEPPVPARGRVGRVLRLGHSGSVLSVAFSPDAKKEPEEPGAAAEPPASARGRVGLVLQLGHSGSISSVAFSPDGKQALTGSDDRTARLWDAVTGKEVRTFQGHTDKVTSVAFSPDGTRVLTGSDDTTARLWDAANGKTIRTFRGHTQQVTSVAFSPDGTQVLTGSLDKTARSWDAATGVELGAFEGHTAGVMSVAYFPDGQRLLTGSIDNTARVWDAESRKVIFTLRNHVNYVTSVAVSADGRRLITGSIDDSIRLWDAATGRNTQVAYPPAPISGEITSVALSPDGKLMLAADTVKSVILWNLVTRKRLRIFRGKADKVQSVAFSPDSTQVLIGGNRTAELWDVGTGKEIHAFQGQTDRADSVAFSPDGKQVLAGIGDGDLSARLWDVVGAKPTRSFRRVDTESPLLAVSSVAFSPDGTQVLTGNFEFSNNTARLWDTTTGKEIRAFPCERKVANLEFNQRIAVAFSPDGKQVLVASDDASLWDAAGGNRVRSFEGQEALANAPEASPQPFGSVAFSPDGTRVFTGGADTRRTRYEHNINQYVVSGIMDTAARLWDADSGREIVAFRGHTEGINSVAYSPDDTHVVTGSDDRTARLWDATTGREIRVLQGHTDRVTAVAFSPDGRYVLTGTGESAVHLWDAGDLSTAPRSPRDTQSNRTIRMWETATGKEIRVFRGHAGGLTAVAFSPDGKQVLSASEDHTVRLWDAASGRELCQMISFHDNTWVVATPENYYKASRGKLEGVFFRVGDRLFPFEQFDLKFNRPDKVIERIGLASPDLVAAYREAYQKRLKRMNFTEEMLGGDFHLPEISQHTSLPFETRQTTLKVKVRARDSKYMLDRICVEVNGVPIHGTQGISLRKAPSNTCEQEIALELSPGGNRIDLSVLNEKGAQSLKETRSIQCNAPAGKPDLYVVVVGVSDYKDARFPLFYARKDAEDLATLLQSKQAHFGAVQVRSILDRDATLEIIGKARAFLEPARVDDVVVVFFAGHGVRVSKRGYYFATADIDFSDPARRGLPWEALEDMLDGIRSRKKLLLVDTCFAGELDEDDARIVRAEQKPGDDLKRGTSRSGLTRVSPLLGLRNLNQLLEETFADLRRGTGAVVIASSGGSETAGESPILKNGVFTHALLRGLKGEADRNRDGHVQVSELRDFVEQEVFRQTDGKQSPTARRENLVVDFTFD